ncbi:MAG: hypothetical protein HY654_10390, partial [Acidobacteria bacterium]|nr:hypothetical protein [Acidobacteriota bacterium]
MKVVLTAMLIALTAGVASAQRAAVSLKVLEADGGIVSLRVPLENKVVKGAPYSAEIEIENVQMLADGNRIVRRTTGRVYRDSAGRIRREEDATPGHHSVVSIFDPVAAVSYSLDDERRVAWKSPAIVSAVGKVLGALQREKAKSLQQALEALEHAKAHADPSLRRKVATGDRDHHADASKIDAAKVAASQPGKTAGVTDFREEALPATMMEGVRVEG